MIAPLREQLGAWRTEPLWAELPYPLARAVAAAADQALADHEYGLAAALRLVLGEPHTAALLAAPLGGLDVLATQQELEWLLELADELRRRSRPEGAPLAEACEATGMSRETLYALARQGHAAAWRLADGSLRYDVALLRDYQQAPKRRGRRPATTPSDTARYRRERRRLREERKKLLGS